MTDIVERLREGVKNDWESYFAEDAESVMTEAADEIERLRDRLRNPTEEMLAAGHKENRLVATNALGLAYVSLDAIWKAMANIVLKEGE